MEKDEAAKLIAIAAGVILVMGGVSSIKRRIRAKKFKKDVAEIIDQRIQSLNKHFEQLDKRIIDEQFAGILKANDISM